MTLDLRPVLIEMGTQGNANGQYAVSLMYDSGIGFKECARMCLKWLARSASQGHIEAQYQLGQHCCRRQLLKEAVQWWEKEILKAAHQEHVLAQVSVYVAYDQGHGVQKDLKKVLYWCQRAAENGNIKAQYNMG
jgi:TPR repeat protein